MELYRHRSDREHAPGLFRSAGYTVGEALMLNNIGWFHGLLGDHEQARAYSQRSLTLSAELGYRRNEGFAGDSLGYAEHTLGNAAVASYQRAIGIFRELGDRYHEANTLSHLGDTHRAAGAPPSARDAWQQAFAILDDIGHADAEKVRAMLADLPPSVAE